MEIIKQMPEYKAIKAYYDERTTSRSGVPLIAHIDEGIEILTLIGASKDAMRAYAIHPLLQEDNELNNLSSEDILFGFSPRVVLLAMEYRARANDWLSDKVNKVGDTFSFDGRPDKGVLKEVKQMLIADKVQNYKDFEKYHLGKHDRSDELQAYFIEWLIELRVTRSDYEKLVAQLDSYWSSK